MSAARRVRDRAWTAALALLAVPLVLSACSAAGSTRPSKHTVLMQGFQFQPDTVEAAVGDTLVWENKDIVPHAVAGGELVSGSIAPDSSWRFVVQKTGTVPYICPFHPTMKGTLIVH